MKRPKIEKAVLISIIIATIACMAMLCINIIMICARQENAALCENIGNAAVHEMEYTNCVVYSVDTITPKFDNAREKLLPSRKTHEAFFIVYCVENGNTHALVVSAIVKRDKVLQSDVLFDMVEEGL